MLKFAAVSAIAAVAALAAAAPASAAPVVRIPVAGKTFVQVDGEIRAAAAAVCGGADDICVSAAVSDGLRQYRAIVRTRRVSSAAAPRIELTAAGVYAARVSLKDKTQPQIQADIRAAAKAVCEPTTLGVAEFDACVGVAVRQAQGRLQALQADNSRVRELASN